MEPKECEKESVTMLFLFLRLQQVIVFKCIFLNISCTNADIELTRQIKQFRSTKTTRVVSTSSRTRKTRPT